MNNICKWRSAGPPGATAVEAEYLGRFLVIWEKNLFERSEVRGFGGLPPLLNMEWWREEKSQHHSEVKISYLNIATWEIPEKAWEKQSNLTINLIFWLCTRSVQYTHTFQHITNLNFLKQDIPPCPACRGAVMVNAYTNNLLLFL